MVTYLWVTNISNEDEKMQRNNWNAVSEFTQNYRYTINTFDVK